MGCSLSAPPAFQFYPGDFNHSTTLLTAAATGAHIRMMCVSWEQGPIPDHPNALVKAMGLGPADPPFKELWPELQPKWKLTKKGWICRRLEKTRQEQDAYRERKRNAGRKGAKARYDCHSTAIAEPEQSHAPAIALRSSSFDLRSSSLSPSPPSAKKPRTKPSAAEPSEFTKFYERYPKHVGRTDALKAWRALEPNMGLIATIHKALDWQINQPKWTRNGGEYINHPATWLNRRLWEDEPFHRPQEADDPNAEAFARVLGGTHGDRR